MIKNELKYRTLTTRAKEIIFDLILEKITFIEAHNALILEGVYLTEDYTLMDY